MAALPDEFCTFDLETIRYHDQVEGGWKNIEAFGMSCAVTHTKVDGFKHWFGKDLIPLLEYLKEAPLVVGFNLKEFDYRVLTGAITEMTSGVATEDELRRLSAINIKDFKTFDILEEIQASLGHKVKLSMMALANFGQRKQGSLKKATDWWKQGDTVKVKDYCEGDVKIARELFVKAVSEKHLLWHWWNHESRVEKLDTAHWGPKALSMMGLPAEPVISNLEVILSLDLSLQMQDIEGGEMTHEQERAVLGLVESIQKNCEALKALGSPVELTGIDSSIKRKFGKRELQ